MRIALFVLLSFLAASVSAADHFPVGAFAEGVYADCPALRDKSLTDIERVRLLRHWAWERVDWSGSGEIDRAFATEEWMRLPVDQMFASFHLDEGGVSCGGTSLCLVRLLEHFGFKTWNLSSGSLIGNDKTNFTHVTTLVEMEHDGKRMVTMHDPSFDLEYVDRATQQPLDYFDLLARLRDRRHDTIEASFGDWRASSRWPEMVVPKRFIKGTPEKYIKHNNCTIEGMCKFRVASNGSYVFSSPRLYQTFYDKLLLKKGVMQPWFKEIVDAGFPADPIYFYSRPIWISAAPKESCNEMLDRALSISRGELGICAIPANF